MGTKVSSSKNNFQFSDNEYAYITMSVDQTTGIADTNPVKFNTMSAGNITFDPATNRATLKKNRTYVSRASLYVGFVDATSYASWQFYNVTSASLVGKTGVALPTSYTGHLAPQTEAFYCFTPTVDTVIEIRLVTPTDINTIYGTSSFWEIQQINIISPVIQDPTRQVAYTSPPFALSMTGGAGFSLYRGVGVFYKLSDGSWHLRMNACYAQTSSTDGSCSIVGVVFKNVATFNQAISVAGSGSAYAVPSVAVPNTDDVSITFSAAVVRVSLSMEVELNAKPTGYALPTDI